MILTTARATCYGTRLYRLYPPSLRSIGLNASTVSATAAMSIFSHILIRPALRSTNAGSFGSLPWQRSTLLDCDRAAQCAAGLSLTGGGGGESWQ